MIRLNVSFQFVALPFFSKRVTWLKIPLPFTHHCWSACVGTATKGRGGLWWKRLAWLDYHRDKMPSKVIPDMNRKVVGGKNQTFLNVFKGEKTSVWVKIGLKFVISHLCQIGGSSHTGVTRWSILCKKDLCTAKRFGFHSNKTFPAFWKTAAALRRNGSRGKRGWRGVFKNTENSSIVNQILECSNFSSKTNWMLIESRWKPF